MPPRAGNAVLTATETRPLRQVIRNQQVGVSSSPVGSMFSRIYPSAASCLAVSETQRKHLEQALKDARPE